MLKKETLALIAKLTKTKVEDLETAIKDANEVDLIIDEKVETFSEDELKTLKSNSYKEGKKAGVEMDVDEVKKELGLDFTGKTIKGLIDAHGKKVIADAKIEPDKKVTELNEKLTNLQNTVKDYETKIADKDKEVSGIKLNSELLKHIPQGVTLEGEEVIAVMKQKGFDFKMENDKLIVYKDGHPMLDKVSNNRAAKEVIEEYAKERKWIAEGTPTPGGRGNGNGAPVNKFMKLSELKKSFADSGKSMLGEEFSQSVEKAVKEYPEFDMNN